jgi:ATP-binding cassette subfamily F protein 3
LQDVNFVIERGDRVALVGVNGAGKSTLIKLLSGSEPLSHGTYRLGHNVEVDYFAQDQYKELDPEARMIDDLGLMAARATHTELRNLLGCFLFSDDDVFKRIGVLSGGERNRYALARMMMHPSNFLLLDEPTNHLDLRAKDVLLEALAGFSGTVVFVSHDRYFIDKLATRIFEIADGHVNVYPGNYEDYIWRKQRSADPGTSEPEVATLPAALAGNDNGSQAEPDGHRSKKINPIKLRQIQERCRELEEQVARVEAEIRGYEEGLATFVSPEETSRVAALLESRRPQLAQLVSEWEKLSLVLESTEA